jgi:membrane-associated HD superfamily phosphohydrolase
MKFKKIHFLMVAMMGLIIVFVLVSFVPAEKAAAKVKLITEWVSDHKDGKVNRYKNEEKEYDKRGNQVSYVNYRKDGSIRDKEISRYDNFGNRIEKISFEEVKESKANSLYDHRTYKYNAHGKKTEESEYNREGQLKNRTVYSYNADGKRTGEVEYDRDGQVKKRLIITFNNQRLVARKISLNGANDTLSVKTYHYVYH